MCNIPFQNSKRESTKSRPLKWKATEFDPDVYLVDDDEWNVGDRTSWSPLDYFNEYFDDSFWNLVADQSNRRALQANLSKPLRATAEEYKKLVGAHVITGVMKLPRLRLYYRPGLKVPAVTQIPRDRFFKLRNYIHFVDNLSVSSEMKKNNRLWKVQPIIDVVKQKCKSLPLSKNLSIDEQMIPFSGTTSLKQYVKGKPNPVGLKNFVMASPQGLVFDFFIYQGANTWPDGKPMQDLGIGGSVVHKLTENVNKGHVIYCDRYFTSVALFQHLSEKGILAVGTIQANRVSKDARQKLHSDAELLKKGRGSYEELVCENDKISVLKWMDNRSVLMATTATGAKPLQNVRRWDKKERKYMLVPCPKTVVDYNSSMGGVDLCDRLISYYRINMRTRKWPVRVFWHFIDLAIINSWILYKMDQLYSGMKHKEIMDLLSFKIYIGESLSTGATGNAMKRRTPLETIDENQAGNHHATVNKKKRMPMAIPTKDSRKTGNAHLPICAVQDSQQFMRCRNANCTGKTRFKCISCDVFLCIHKDRQCFFEFHT